MLAPSPIPRRDENEKSAFEQQSAKISNAHHGNDVASYPAAPSPKLRLHLQDISHESAKIFLEYVFDPSAVLRAALCNIITYLYTSPKPVSTASSQPHCVHFTPSLPKTRSVTVILRDFSGVAYTTSIDLDSDHKEIHFSLSHIAHSATLKEPRDELVGVLTHELVHCYQHTSPPDDNAVPHPPSGLIEGIADFVRLKAGLSPPHWHRPLCSADRPDSWDRGYQDTAFFLEWLEDVKVGSGAVGMLNDRLLRTGYVGEEGEASPTSAKQSFWRGLFGASVQALWDEYGEYLNSKEMFAN
ncbi:hypothetical protein PRK78_001327 [Emydomyces testavorans]|uniref:PBSP domain-containing protein n=1 Tax=Emydomyces testavorans TaxID=2070801 RepID=A0AAF0DCI4_9EURO|nr:hypothetical protein PRK78_001327 [Emydomyces testavorans]